MAGKIFVDESGIVAKKKDAERRIVVDEDAAIAIEHAAARSDDGNGANAITFGHLAVLIGVDDLKFPETEEQQSDHAHDDVGSNGQPGLWQTIVVAKPVRHENPARECFIVALVKRTARSSGRFIARPARSRDILASRKKILQRGFRNVRRKLFSKEKIRKIPSGIPNHCRTCASLKQQSHFKRSTWERVPQAVLKDSCLGNTLWKTGRWKWGQGVSRDNGYARKFGYS